MSEELKLTVMGMTCSGCENAVQRVLSQVDGVAAATASHQGNEVTVIYDAARTDPAAIARAIEAAGYQVQG